MYKMGGNQKKGAKFDTFLKILYRKKPDYTKSGPDYNRFFEKRA